MLDILIIDDEADIRRLISDILIDDGYTTRGAANSTEAMAEFKKKVPNAVILDVWLAGSDLDGLGILERIKSTYPLMPVVIISGHGTVETAVTAIKKGAYDYLEKPFSPEKLAIVLKRACEAAKLTKENIILKTSVIDKTDIIGESPLINKLRSEIDKVSQSPIRVLIQGAIGSGKGTAARLIHKKSQYCNGPFVTFSPCGLTAQKINQDILGCTTEEDGKKMKGVCLLETANKGTFYIDEICDIPLESQIQLLRILQDGLPLSSVNTAKLDVRIISSTSKNLEEEMRAGRLRQDLYYRLNVATIKTPTLEERKSDITSLVEYFVNQLVRHSGMQKRIFAADAIAAMQAYDWPGNIRQLHNVVEWALMMNTSSNPMPIKSSMLPQEIIRHTSANAVDPMINNDAITLPLREAREMFERQYLEIQMSRFNNNISKTSAFVGMERSALHRKLKLLAVASNGKIDDSMPVDTDLLEIAGNYTK